MSEPAAAVPSSRWFRARRPRLAAGPALAGDLVGSGHARSGQLWASQHHGAVAVAGAGALAGLGWALGALPAKRAGEPAWHR